MFVCTAHAVESLAIERAWSSREPTTTALRVVFRKDHGQALVDSQDFKMTRHVDYSMAQWSTRVRAQRDEVLDFGITPVFRIEPVQPSNWVPYAEAGLGVHWLSDREIYAGRRFGTNLQFGSHLGVGIRFGDQGQFDLSYRIQHLSNAGIRGPNPGIDFHLIRLQMAL